MNSSPIADLSAQEIAWKPSEEQIQRSRMMRFAREHGIETYDELTARAASVPEWFWDAVSTELGLVWTEPYSQTVDMRDGLPWPRWFVGGRMNYVTSAVDRWLGDRADALALIWEGDDGSVVEYTFAELSLHVKQAANALKAAGVKRGDRVGLYLPMIPQTAVAMLACGYIGAVIIPIFSGYGAEAAAKRIHDASVSTLITADGFHRRGKLIPMKPNADQAAEMAGTIERLITVTHSGNDVPWDDDRDLRWEELIAAASSECEPADTRGDDLFMIIYTSGTTGRPKGAVHTHAGFPVKAAQDLAFCFDIQPGDRLCWITDIGWMMGPWAIAGGLIAGATLVLYEGTPDYPKPDRLWQLVDDHEVTVLGISPTAIRALMPKGDEWVERHEMPTLRAIGSTGEPWNPGPWMWTSQKVGKGRCPIVNYAGGTEISGGIVTSTTIHPQKPASFAGPVVGVPADVVDASGNSVRGSVGELVIRGPWVGMTQGFLDDPERYLDAYWRTIPDMWVHGDFALVDEDGFWYILGRSDDTMNIAGKRTGPAEIESAAVTHPAVQETAVVGVPHEIKGEVAVIFAILVPGYEPSSELENEILDAVAGQLGRPLRPQSVVFVKDLPRTRNAKILRRVIRGRYLGQEDLGDLSALENPEAVDAIEPVG